MSEEEKKEMSLTEWVKRVLITANYKMDDGRESNIILSAIRGMNFDYHASDVLWESPDKLRADIKRWVD